MIPRLAFSAPWGRAIRIITPLTVILVLAVTLGLVAAAMFDPRTPRWALLLGLATCGGVLLIPGVFLVRGYRLEGGDQLVILRPLYVTRVSLSGLHGAEARPEAFKGMVLRVGNGGYGGFIGWFWNRSLGGFRAWVTDPERSVLLRFTDRQVMISPDDPAAFIAALEWLRGGRSAR